jgi:hypothetical protein
MEKLLEKLFDIKRIPSKFLFVIWGTCGFVLFAPPSWLAKLNIPDFNKIYGKYLGISFILCTVFLVVIIYNYLSSIYLNRKRKRNIEKGIIEAVNNLDIHEKALLREFYINSKSTLQLPIDNETVAGLSNKRIIYQVSSTGFTSVYGIYWSYAMTQYAKGLITLSILELPSQPTEAQAQIIMNNRPKWAKEKTEFESLL